MFHRMMNYGELDVRPSELITKDLIKKHLPKFKRHDDLVIIHESAWDEFKRVMPVPVVSNENSPLSIDEDELASLVCQTIQKPICRRLAIERGVKNDGYRTPSVHVLLGENGIVTHRDNQILYQFDVTKCMFSFGNVREKIRMAELDCSSEIVVDLFAGIGYFTLPLLVHAKAKHLYACEWNPDAIEALRKNLKLNKVDASRYTVIEGDNRIHRRAGVAQRVVLGILPSSMGWMKTALECVDGETGAVLHCHDLVDTNLATPVRLANNHNQQTKNNSFDKQSSTSEPTPPVNDKQQQPDSQSALNQSISSCSTSSHSTIEKLSAPLDDSYRLSNSICESDKDTSSPVLLDKPSSYNTISSINSSFFDSTTSTAAHSNSTTNEQTSLTLLQQEDSIIEPPLIDDNETGCYESRGMALIARIQDELDARNMTARLMHIQPVKSYAPHIMHVVFDIKLEPRGPPSSTNSAFDSTTTTTNEKTA